MRRFDRPNMARAGRPARAGRLSMPSREHAGRAPTGKAAGTARYPTSFVPFIAATMSDSIGTILSAWPVASAAA